MNDVSTKNLGAFFAAIAGWRSAYRRARLHFLGVRTPEHLAIVTARIYLDTGGPDSPKSRFIAGRIEAGQWEIPQQAVAVEDVVQALTGDTGFDVEGFGLVRLVSDTQNEIFVSSPTLLHPEGLNTGNRLAVLTLGGLNWVPWIPQPETDWLLKAADSPYDSIQELSIDYGLGALRGDRSTVEVVARTAVEVLARSHVEGTSAKLGVWMANTLDRSKARVGYRVMNKGEVLQRGALSGPDLQWQQEGLAEVGIAEFQIPAGAVVHCIASYDGHAHHVQWRADPKILQNPRATVLGLVDQNQEILRGYLQPEMPPRGRAADDFEMAIGWLLWAVGFSGAGFGLNARTRDAFDTVAVSPNGDFAVVECTLGLLRADGKLSRLAARAATLRAALDASNMRTMRVLPVIVTAMSVEQVQADVADAEELGVLVLTKENLDRAFNELLRFPDANGLYEEAFRTAYEKRVAKKNPT